MGTVRYQCDVPLFALAAILVECTRDEKASKFALSAGERVDADGW
jgi:hypothetical protein